MDAGPTGGDEGNCADVMADPSCTAKVSAVKACISATLDSYVESVKGASCGERGEIELVQPDACKSLPPSCVGDLVDDMTGDL